MHEKGTFSNSFCEAVLPYKKLDKNNSRNKKNCQPMYYTEVFKKILAKNQKRKENFSKP